MLDLSHRTLFKAVLFTGVAAAFPAAAQGPAGMLECNVSPSVGAVITSGKALSCVFHPVQGDIQLYTGSITTVGVDIGFTGPGKLSWGVAIASAAPSPFPLAGTYTGASAGVTLLAGASANSLIGGNGNSISLQPLSVSTQTGIDLSAGIGTLTLTPVLPPPPPPLPQGGHH